MNQKLTTILAVGATSFLLVGVGAVASTRVQPLQISTPGSQSVVAADLTDASAGPTPVAPQVAFQEVNTSPISTEAQGSVESGVMRALDTRQDDQVHSVFITLNLNHRNPAVLRGVVGDTFTLGKASAKTVKALIQAQTTSAMAKVATMNLICTPTPAPMISGVQGNVKGSTRIGGSEQ